MIMINAKEYEDIRITKAIFEGRLGLELTFLIEMYREIWEHPLTSSRLILNLTENNILVQREISNKANR